MSRTAYQAGASHTGFPRVSGDEPLGRQLNLRITRFSPRERG